MDSIPTDQKPRTDYFQTVVVEKQNNASVPLKKYLFIVIGLVILIGISFFVYNLLSRKAVASKVTLTYWGLFEPATVMQPIIADFEKANPNIKINYESSSLQQYRERLQAALSKNTGPDIFRIHQSWVPMFGANLSSIPSTIYDVATFEKTFYPSAKETLKYQGNYVAVPLEYDGLALFYNEDIFKARGKVPPKDWDELITLANDLVVRDPASGKISVAGVALGATNVDHWSDILGLMFLQTGIDPAKPAVCDAETSGVGGQICRGADALSFFTRFTRVDKVWDPTSAMSSSTFAFATGKLAMYFGPSWRVFDIENYKNTYKSTVNYKIVPIPQLKGVSSQDSINWASYWVEAVSKTSLHQAEAWEFLKYLSSKEVMQKLYQTQSATRLFGEPYSRVDMAESLKTQPLVGAFIQEAPTAKNWYMSSSTNDNGINSQIIKYYEDAVNAVNMGTDPVTALNTTSQGITQVLRQYGLSR